MGSSVLAVVPARIGSKGIPRKNLRELGDSRLVGHAIETAVAAEWVDEVALTTDSREIARVGEHHDADHVIDRPDRLATDEVPLAPVVTHAADAVDGAHEYVLCLQPTVPLIEPDTVDEGIRAGIAGESDSVVYVRDSTHHYWRETEDGFEPVSPDRENRQAMPTIYGEVGVFCTHRSLVEDGRRVGDDPLLHPVPAAEGVDIDTYDDWVLAESRLDRQQLVYRVTGNDRNGSGHVHRGITIADHLFAHDVEFAVLPSDDLAIDLLEESNYDYRVFDSDDDFLEYVAETSPDVVANDMLDTSEAYVAALAEAGPRVVNFEDLGEGAEHADAVVNAIYEHSNPPDDHHYGYEYFCLRSEFQYVAPTTDLESVDRIMVSYGGTDENDLTARTLSALSTLDDALDREAAPDEGHVDDADAHAQGDRPGTDLHVDVVLGLGYEEPDTLEPIVASFPPSISVEVAQAVDSMAEHMAAADLLLTSNGRTLYEACALDLPVISIAQNHREQKHPFAHVSRGIRSLGQAEVVDERRIRDAVVEYVRDRRTRETMREAMADHDVANGIDRITDVLFEGDDATR